MRDTYHKLQPMPVSLFQFARFLGFTIAALLTFVSSLQSQPAETPNLLFILTDQHRRDGVGAYGETEVMTPNLDRIATEGIRFNRAYTAQPVCAPNRGAMMSGLFPHNHGVLENTWDLDTDVRILPDLYRENGYRTGYFGKWHLGDPARDAWDEMPIYPGDGRGDKHYFNVDGKKVYQTEVITPDVIEFMTKDPNQPFVAYASYYPPHPAYSVPKAYEDMYADIYPDDERRRIYYAMCTAVDDAVGDLLQALDDKGLTDNTLVVFTTEHGHNFEHRWNDHDKRLCYDISARVPMLMRFPGVIKEGQVSESLISSIDLYPTMTNLMGLVAGPGLDGQNLGNQISGRTDKGRASLVMVNIPFIDKSGSTGMPDLEKGEERCIVKGDWKLILSTVREPELYHLPTDPSETDNRWADSKDTTIIADLSLALHYWGKRTKDPLMEKLLGQL
jgi:arylsulfatase A-like enzyme